MTYAPILYRLAHVFLFDKKRIYDFMLTVRVWRCYIQRTLHAEYNGMVE